MISRKKFTVYFIISAILAAVAVAALTGGILFHDRFNSGLSGIMVYWYGEPLSGGVSEEIPYQKTGGTVSKMYLNSSDNGVSQVRFRFIGKTVTDLKLHSGSDDLSSRLKISEDNVMGIGCINVVIPICTPLDEDISGSSLTLTAYSEDVISFEMNFNV